MELSVGIDVLRRELVFWTSRCLHFLLYKEKKILLRYAKLGREAFKLFSFSSRSASSLVDFELGNMVIIGSVTSQRELSGLQFWSSIPKSTKIKSLESGVLPGWMRESFAQFCVRYTSNSPEEVVHFLVVRMSLYWTPIWDWKVWKTLYEGV